MPTFGKRLDNWLLRRRMGRHGREIKSFCKSLDDGQGVFAQLADDGTVRVVVLEGIEAGVTPLADMYYADDTPYYQLNGHRSFRLSAKLSRPPWLPEPEYRD